jgi:hypothetical protein
MTATATMAGHSASIGMHRIEGKRHTLKFGNNAYINNRACL